MIGYMNIYKIQNFDWLQILSTWGGIGEFPIPCTLTTQEN